MTSLGDTIEKVGITLTNNLPTSSGTMSTSDGTNGRTGTVNKKLEDLEQHVYDVQNPQHMTTDFGHKVSNTDNWLKVGSKDHVGAHLLEDQVAREKIHRFDHERIPERVVHARGTAAFGKFTLQESLEDISCAGVLTDTTRETPVFLRFSTVQGSRGSADTVRDVRGFAVKFYTEEGNWDIVGNNIPVFFIQESMKFPDVIHAVKPEPHNEVPQAQSAHNNFWDFAFMHEESTHMCMWTMSDRSIPRSYRMMQGFGVNTFSLVNAKGERVFVKFHFTPELGVHSLVWDEALKINGQDPDFHRKDLWEAIEAGSFPKWKFGVQVIKESDEHSFEFDILDATKVWPEDLVPVRYVGTLELNANPDNYFAQTEQVAFCTSHIVPGIDYSDDPLLQGRNFSYFDTQLSRLGINWQDLPINRPICPVMNNNRDGQGQHRIPRGTVNYWPNRFDANPPAPAAFKKDGGFLSYPAKESGIKARMLSDKFKEHFKQAQLFYNSMSAIEKQHITNAFSFELDHCQDPIVYKRLVQRLTEIDLSLAQAVAEKCGAETPTKQTRINPGHKAKGLSQFDFLPANPTIESRRIAILIADGYDHESYEAVVNAIQKEGALPFPIANKRQLVKARQSGKTAQPTNHFNGMRSTLFDAIFIPDGDHVETLIGNGIARHYVREAFSHNKAIGSVGRGNLFVEKAILAEVDAIQVAGQSSDIVDSYGVVSVGSGQDLKKFIAKFFEHIANHRCWQRELDGLTYMVAA